MNQYYIFLRKFNENNKTDTSYRKNTSYKYPSPKIQNNKTINNQYINTLILFRTIKEINLVTNNVVPVFTAHPSTKGIFN